MGRGTQQERDASGGRSSPQNDTPVECSQESSDSALERRSFLQATALAGAGAVVGTVPERARADHTECSVADRFVPSPNYGTRQEEIDWIVIHVTTGPYTSAINWFENPDSNVSAHYVVSNYADTAYEPGHVTQMVHHADNAWHARRIANHRSIGIELEWIDGHDPDEPITGECYEAAAQLVRCIADQYDVPLTFYDEETCIQNEPGGIIGHTHVPDGDCSTFDHDGRTCPYPDFDPAVFMEYVTDENDDDDDENGGEDGDDGENGDDGEDGDDGDESFNHGDEVVTTANLNGREQPGLDSDVVAVLDEGTTAEVINGPEVVDDITWWGLHEPIENHWVWCAGGYLERNDSDDEDGEDGEDDEGDSDDDSWCFVTTATARDDATLRSLRRFRDESMSATPPGRALVRLYYHVSPPVAKSLTRRPESRTFRATRAIIEACASLSDRQTETSSRVERAALATVITALYVAGFLTAVCGHVALRARTLPSRKESQGR